MSIMSLLESREQRYMKTFSNNNHNDDDGDDDDNNLSVRHEKKNEDRMIYVANRRFYTGPGEVTSIFPSFY